MILGAVGRAPLVHATQSLSPGAMTACGPDFGPDGILLPGTTLAMSVAAGSGSEEVKVNIGPIAIANGYALFGDGHVLQIELRNPPSPGPAPIARSIHLSVDQMGNPPTGAGFCAGGAITMVLKGPGPERVLAIDNNGTARNLSIMGSVRLEIVDDGANDRVLVYFTPDTTDPNHWAAVSGLVYDVPLKRGSISTTTTPPVCEMSMVTLAVLRLDPRGTYRRTNQDPGADAARMVPLAAMGISAGDTLRLIRQGDFAYIPGGLPTGRTLDCVFSTDSVILDPSQPERIPGAIAAGAAHGTAPTTIGGLLTDIPEDFAVTDSLDVVVPNGAQYLFVCADDEFHGDNEDANHDFAIMIKGACYQASAVDGNSAPTPLALHQNAPNPFNPTTEIVFDVRNSDARVRIGVYDLAGRPVRTLVDRLYEAGVHSVSWDGRDDCGGRAASGVYFYRMNSGSFTEMRKMVLLK